MTSMRRYSSRASETSSPAGAVIVSGGASALTPCCVLNGVSACVKLYRTLRPLKMDVSETRLSQMNTEVEGSTMSETIRRVSDHPMKTSFDATPRDTALRAEDGWMDMDVRWLLTRE